MELRLENGDYVKSGGHTLESVSGTEELAQRLMLRLRARRGGFALRPDYGSRLYTLSGLRPSERETPPGLRAEALSGRTPAWRIWPAETSRASRWPWSALRRGTVSLQQRYKVKHENDRRDLQRDGGGL
jgi:hypothetical protein